MKFGKRKPHPKILKVVRECPCKHHSWVEAETHDGKKIIIRKPNGAIKL